jgi:hypothetical protein
LFHAWFQRAQAKVTEHQGLGPENRRQSRVRKGLETRHPKDPPLSDVPPKVSRTFQNSISSWGPRLQSIAREGHFLFKPQ